jgi:hypothetical protein
MIKRPSWVLLTAYTSQYKVLRDVLRVTELKNALGVARILLINIDKMVGCIFSVLQPGPAWKGWRISWEGHSVGKECQYDHARWWARDVRHSQRALS